MSLPFNISCAYFNLPVFQLHVRSLPVFTWVIDLHYLSNGLFLKVGPRPTDHCSVAAVLLHVLHFVLKFSKITEFTRTISICKQQVTTSSRKHPLLEINFFNYENLILKKNYLSNNILEKYVNYNHNIFATNH